MPKWLFLFLIFPLISKAQLKEFEVREMERPDVAVVQANTQWSDDALLLVYSSLDGLQFRSSMGAVNKQTYNNTAGRYEILVKPVKQMIFVAKPGFMELKIATVNPSPKDVFYFMAEEKESEVVSTNPGKVKIITDPPGANLYLNGIKTADFTPFTGNLNPGETRGLVTGHSLSGSPMIDKKTRKAIAESCRLGGFSDWRYPTKGELLDIYIKFGWNELASIYPANPDGGARFSNLRDFDNLPNGKLGGRGYKKLGYYTTTRGLPYMFSHQNGLIHNTQAAVNQILIST